MIRYEIENLPELRRKFDPKIIDKALERALQVAATKTRTRISTDVRKTYNVKAGDVAKTVRLTRIPIGRLLVYTGSVIGLEKFGARQKIVRTATGRRRGVTVQVKKTGARKLVKGGFQIQKGKAILRRVGRGRLPIERRFGPSIPQMVSNPAVIELATLKTGEDAAIEFNRQMEVLLSRT